MVIGSSALQGETGKIYIEAKGGTEYSHDAHIMGYSTPSFAKSFDYENGIGIPFVGRNPYNPATVSFEFIADVNTTTGSDYFSDFVFNSISGLTAGFKGFELSDNSPTNYKIKLEFYNYTGTFGDFGTNDEGFKIIFYNAKGVSINQDASSTGVVKGTISFFVSPFDDVGSSNYKELYKTAGTATTAWATEETTFDTQMGY